MYIGYVALALRRDNAKYMYGINQVKCMHCALQLGAVHMTPNQLFN